MTDPRIQSFVDECVPKRKKRFGLKNANEDEGEEERDGNMTEPIRMMNAEKGRADETAKELRASLPITTCSHASSSRSDDETQE